MLLSRKVQQQPQACEQKSNVVVTRAAEKTRNIITDMTIANHKTKIVR